MGSTPGALRNGLAARTLRVRPDPRRNPRRRYHPRKFLSSAWPSPARCARGLPPPPPRMAFSRPRQTRPAPMLCPQTRPGRQRDMDCQFGTSDHDIVTGIEIVVGAKISGSTSLVPVTVDDNGNSFVAGLTDSSTGYKHRNQPQTVFQKPSTKRPPVRNTYESPTAALVGINSELTRWSLGLAQLEPA
jgi:hypothetical protein